MSVTAADWHPVDFETASVDAAFVTLTVSGNMPNMGSKLGVKLQPRVYVDRPEYWAIDVLWDRDGALFTSLAPYTVTLDLKACTGSAGIEVVGKRSALKIARPA